MQNIEDNLLIIRLKNFNMTQNLKAIKIAEGISITMSEINKALERLRQKRQQLNAQIHKAEALKRKAQRQQDTRRKILIGAYYLEQAEQTGTYQQLVEQLNSFLTRSSDRKLFGLEGQKTKPA